MTLNRRAQLAHNSEMRALAYFSQYTSVAKPLCEGDPADLLIRVGKVWVGVQVKTAYQGASGMMVNVQRTDSKGRTPYVAGDVGMFFVVIPNSDIVYVVPLGAVVGKTRVAVSTLLGSGYGRKWDDPKRTIWPN